MQRITAEFIGTAILLAAVVGSGIMAERLAAGNEAIALLANAIATGCALVAILLTVGPISGAHLNPAVTAALAARGFFPWRDVPGYWLAQITGALLGVLAAHLMFELPLLEISTKTRPGVSLIFSEAVATFGLVAIVLAGVQRGAASLPYAVAAYITAAYWFTASTSFANPAVALARCFTDTFSGLSPASLAGFVLGQAGGALLATLLVRNTAAPERAQRRI